MLLFAICTDLDYPTYIYSNDKFLTLFVKGFTNTDAMKPHFYKYIWRLQNFYVTNEPDFMLFALALQILFI